MGGLKGGGRAMGKRRGCFFEGGVERVERGGPRKEGDREKEGEIVT